MAFAASAFASLAATTAARRATPRNLDRAKATLDSIYAHYGVAENRLLRENYPFNTDLYGELPRFGGSGAPPIPIPTSGPFRGPSRP